jgi:formate dehydrogenase beta subunit
VASIWLKINEHHVEVEAGVTILEAARKADIYIPVLCHHPDLPPARQSRSISVIYQGDRRLENQMPGRKATRCGLCLVSVNGVPGLVSACDTVVEDGMQVVTDNDQIRDERRENLVRVFSRHPHACLTCAQQHGCPRTLCSSNVPENERCCPKFGRCELQDVAGHIGLPDATPRWVPTNLAVLRHDPLCERNYNLCIGCTRCVRACGEVRGVEALGFVFDAHGQVQVGTVAADLADAGCKFCMACVQVCPTGALQDKNARLDKKEEDPVPCTAACPVGIDIPGYIRLIARERTDEALAVIQEKVALPGILGRVCDRPCEDACRRGHINAPVAICALKRFAADAGRTALPPVSADTGNRIAVVGSGPAGLTAAFHLRRKGHSVTLFDCRPQPGGMLRYGIPSFRLPRSVLDQEIQAILDMGVEFIPNQMLGRDVDIDDLKRKGFDAVFLALGAQANEPIPIEGCDLPDVLRGVDFLRQVVDGSPVRLKENVVVIGGGNVAVDAALTALRCGATNVTITCLEPEADMPASPSAMAIAFAEGVNLLSCRGPEKILSDNGRIIGLDLVECISVVDKTGNFRPSFNEHNKTCLMVDQIILAAGQTPDLTFMKKGSGIETDGRFIVVDRQTLQTGAANVWAGGDVIGLPGSVVHAVAAGRKAAASIDLALGGDGRIDNVLFKRRAASPFIGRDEGFARQPRIEPPQTDIHIRKRGFDEITLGYSIATALQEAKRCLQCDLRPAMGSNPHPPAGRLTFTRKNIETVPETEGVFQLLAEDCKVMAIKGTPNLRRDLLQLLDDSTQAALFEFMEDKLYSKRENELIQQYLQEHGEIPGEYDEDLF